METCNGVIKARRGEKTGQRRLRVKERGRRKSEITWKGKKHKILIKRKTSGNNEGIVEAVYWILLSLFS